MEYKVLSNGYKIPSICFGTDIVDYRSSFSDKTKQKIKFIIRTILRKDTRKIKRDKGIKECFVHSLEYGCNFFRYFKSIWRIRKNASRCIKREKKRQLLCLHEIK